MTAACEAAGARPILLRVGPLTFSGFSLGAGPLVLLIHGFPDGPETFRHQLPALAEAGYRAVAVTLRGYEAPTRPADGDYSLPRLAEDVLGWMDALGARTAHLIGHDWGANLAFAAARAAPERIDSLTLIAVPHPARLGAEIAADPAQRQRSGYILFFQIPALAEAWVAARGGAFVTRLWRRWSPGWAVPAPVIEGVRRRFADRATARAALEYYRQLLRPPPREKRRIGELLGGVQAVRTLGICGADDGCISAAVFRRALRDEDFAAGVQVETVAGGGHFVHQERPEVVNSLLLAWLARDDPSAQPDHNRKETSCPTP